MSDEWVVTMPKLGETKEEKAARDSELMEWALGSGAARDIVQHQT